MKEEKTGERMIRFSVLMSVYFKESADNLYQALQSLINQSLRPNEIVLVKDGRLTDPLEKVITAFEKENVGLVNVVPIAQNSGLGNALSVGLNACTYDYVARMDSDDISAFHRFEKQTAFLREHPHIDVVGCNLSEFDREIADSTFRKVCPELHEDIVRRIRLRSPLNHPTIMFRKKRLLDAGGYNSETLMFEDYALFLRLWKAGFTFHNIPETLYYMRVDSNLNSIRRRRGRQYLLHEINFLKYAHKIDAFTRFDQLKYAIIRFPIRLMPSWIVSLIYRNFLRQK
ncbi:glycosyltransferase [Sphingobacterium sp. InxBP1]|uniref:glycosyltransferase n=1 Tax=Sphingobacterium sp. InxBP1 TaxID=2870328 RepID=UPI002242F6EE|nr:glycosyltransferase [Sphingobacterium sp. InxBP1]MCW8310891.1 glycosyltransferase [Sphingobacterium sp. InxBP1]